MDAFSRVIIFLGPPGSGKGTQSAFLASHLGIPAVSTGELLRQECRSHSALGETVRSVLAAGRLVNDELMNRVVARRLSDSDCSRGCILDGYPRTVSQGEFLADLLEQADAPLPVVFDMQLSSDDVVSRLISRRQCPSCGKIYGSEKTKGTIGERLNCELDGSPLEVRQDERPDVVIERLRLYAENVKDIVRFYRAGNYRLINAARAADQITKELVDILDWQFQHISDSLCARVGAGHECAPQAIAARA